MDWEGLSANPALQKVLDHLEVKCRYEGCSTNVLSMLHKEHESQCGYKPTICPHSSNCGIILTKNLQKHVEEECPERTMECPYNCGQSLKLSAMLDHIKHSCEATETDCNYGCGKKLKRKEMPNYVGVECPLAPVSCDYVQYGCNHAILRSHMKDHLDSTIHEHMSMLTKALKAQDGEIATLKSQLENRRCRIDQKEAKEFCERLLKDCGQVSSQVYNFCSQRSQYAVPYVTSTVTEIKNAYNFEHFISLIFLVFLYGFIFPRFISHITLFFAALNLFAGLVKSDVQKVIKSAQYGIAAFLGVCHCLMFCLLAIGIGCALKMYCIRRGISFRRFWCRMC